MNRTEMRAVLASGGTVLHKGRHIRKEAELPSDSELALDNGTEEEALQAVTARVAQLEAEKKALEEALAEKNRVVAAETKAAKPQPVLSAKTDEEKVPVKK